VRDRREARAALGRGDDTRRWILYVGRIEDDKGAHDLAEAFMFVGQSDPQAALFLVGNGTARKALEDRLAPFGDRVIFTGRAAPRPRSRSG
jgi:glycosyltransferase involved in cell wall biosynthesis